MTEKNQALIFKYDVADDIRVTKPENDVRALDGFTIDMADKRLVPPMQCCEQCLFLIYML